MTLSSGRGGDDLSIDGTVERHPGEMTHSEAAALEGLEGHALNVTRVCIGCNVHLTPQVWSGGRIRGKRVWRAAYMLDPNVAKLRAVVESLVPTWSAVSVQLPMSLCGVCCSKATGGNSAKFAKAATKVLTPFLEQRVQRACDGMMCILCRTVLQRSRGSQHQRSPLAAVQGTGEAITAIDRGLVRVPRIMRPPTPTATAARRTSTQPTVDIGGLMHILRATNASGAQIRVAARVAKKRYPGVFEGGSQNFERCRKELFTDLFSSMECKYSRDGGMVSCLDLVAYVRRCITLSGYQEHQLRMAIFNADGGQASLKLLMLLRYADDPLLTVDDPEEKDSGPAEQYLGGFDAEKSGSVNRYHQLRNIPGGHEDIEVFRVLLGDTGIPQLKAAMPWLHSTWNSDMKATNIYLGIGQHSSRRPSAKTLFSQYEQHSDPTTLRTMRGIIADYDAGVAKGLQSINHNSVVAQPVALFCSAEFIGES